MNDVALPSFGKYSFIVAILFLSSCVAMPSPNELATTIPTVEGQPSATTETVEEPTALPTVEATLTPIPPTATATTHPLTPGMIFHGGKVITMDEDSPSGEAIAILEDRVLAVGSDEEILALRSPETEVIDLQGRTILPGFVDAHSHLFNAADQYGLDWNGAQQMALKQGITSVANMYGTPEFIADMKDFAENDRLKIRTSLYLNYNNNCGELFGDWYHEHPPGPLAGEMLQIGGVKIFTDGGSCGAPAVSYDHPAYGQGDLWLTQDQLNEALREIQASGYQAAIHALGDRAVEQALNGIAYALDGQANTFRHRIDHNALVRDDLLARYSEVGVVPLIFGSYAICTINMEPPPVEQDGWEWRWRDLIDQNPGLQFAWHSDMFTRFFGQISPLQHLYSLVTPFEVGNDGATICETPAWVSAKSLTVEEVLPMMTIKGAYAIFQEGEVGSLRPGKLADLIVLPADPTQIEPEAIIDLQVLMTMVGGQAVYCGEGEEGLCPS